jgi:hypothetical protein
MSVHCSPALRALYSVHTQTPSARVARGTPLATYLLRVFVDIDYSPPDVVTVYQTSKVTK